MKNMTRVERAAIVTVAMMGWLSVFSTSEAATAEDKKLNMFVGETKVLENVAVKRIAIGNGALLKARVLTEGQLLLIAEKEGSTSVHLWHPDGRESSINVRITKDDPEVRVRLEKMIHMDVKIVEFRKSALKTLGIDWQKSIDGPTLAVAGDWRNSTLFRPVPTDPMFSNLPNSVKPFQAYFGVATAVTSRINYLASTGDAFSIAEPRLSCRNGGQAKFLAGGQLPIPVRGANGEITVQFKDFGVILDINPYADDSGVIAARIKTEVSSVDQSINVLGVPGFLTRRTETEMNVRENETIVISGLVTADMAKDVGKVPGLGDLPILGHLFKSSNFRDQSTELVLFVTPKIFTPQSTAQRQTIEDTEQRAQKHLKLFDKRLRHGILD